MSHHQLNGIDVEQLQETVGAIQGDPEIARFEFRNANEWVQGGENRSTIRDFYGAKAWDQSRSEPFVFTNGEPPVLLGDNEGANPVEFLLHALAGCVTTSTVVHAAARGIRIQSISTELRGRIDLHGFLDLDPKAPVGYESIEIDMKIEADCSDGELDELLRFAEAHSPVCSTVCRPVPVTLRRV